MKPSIVFVQAFGGPPIDYVMPALARRCAVHVLLLSVPDPYNKAVIEQFAQTVTEKYAVSAPHIVDTIAVHAKSKAAAAIVTFSEFLVICVAQACESLGLRGVGPNALLTRDKLAMRSRWAAAGLPGPDFLAVASASDLREAARKFAQPFVLKDAFGAGAIGTQIVALDSDLDAIFARTQSVITEARQRGIGEFSPLGEGPIKLIAEVLMEGAADEWFSDRGRGDFVSVEGMVIDGVPRSLALTGRMRPLPPFCESADLAPSGIDADMQAQLFSMAQEAVGALGLQDCATHTEFKLMPGRTVGLLEVAARIGGTAIAHQTHAVYGICLVDQLVSGLLGMAPQTPLLSHCAPQAKAAAGLEVLGADAQGRPWKKAYPFDAQRIDWTSLVGPDTGVRLERSLSSPPGTLIAPYGAGRGVLNAGAVLFVTATDPYKLLSACQNIMNGLENALIAACASTATQ